MNIFSYIFIFLLGTIIGSFLNVVIYRFNTGRSISKGRSICMTCEKKLKWYELIPIFSYLIQLGKCRKCAEKISHQYPLVEFITGLLFLVISFYFSPLLSLSLVAKYIFLVSFYTFVFCLLIVIAVYDFRHKIIPDQLVYFFSAISFISIFINPIGLGPIFIIPSISYFISGPVLALPFVLIWFLSKGKWMGLGDGKLMLGLGWLLGLHHGLAAIVLSFWIGALVSIIYMFISKNKVSMKTEIPFAPFLIIGTFITFIFGFDIFSLSNLFNF